MLENHPITMHMQKLRENSNETSFELIFCAFKNRATIKLISCHEISHPWVLFYRRYGQLCEGTSFDYEI